MSYRRANSEARGSSRAARGAEGGHFFTHFAERQGQVHL